MLAYNVIEQRLQSVLSIERYIHTLGVVKTAKKLALRYGEDVEKAALTALLHDCAKNLPADSPYLEGFSLPTEWGEVPAEVAHQFSGAFICERHFGVEDAEILDAIRYHTSGRPNMGDLEKIIFLADMIEPARNYDCVEQIRALFWKDLDGCLEYALYETLNFLEKKGGEVYPLTRMEYTFCAENKGL